MSFHSHIGILGFPWISHTPALLMLVKKLAAASPAYRFSFYNPATSSRWMISDHVSNSNGYNNLKWYDVWDGTPQGFTGSPLEAIEFFREACPGNFEKTIEESEQQVGLKVSCFIVDAYLWFAGELAEKRQVPWLAFWTASSCYLSPYMHAEEIKSVIISKGGDAAISVSEAGEISIIPGLGKVCLGDLSPAVLSDENVPVMGKIIKNAVEKLPKCTAIILNSFEELSPIITSDLKMRFKHFLNIGPSIIASPSSSDPGCQSWLDKQNKPESVVYISFGTVIVPPESELAALAEALETCGLPFLWSLKDEARKLLPHGFLDRTSEQGKIIPWAPQMQVLEHQSVGVFVTHCGWNSILESICTSVPMICRPFFGDQMLNGRMVQDCWKIGVRVKGGVFTKSETMEALNLVMSSESGKQIRENVHLLKQKAADAVKPDGSSTKNVNKLLEIIGAAEWTTNGKNN